MIERREYGSSSRDFIVRVGDRLPQENYGNLENFYSLGLY